MGHCPQNHRSSSHCPGRGIRFQFLHRPMRIITLAIIHCSATPQGVRLSFDNCRREHIRRGFSDIGYHFYIRKDGTMTQHRKRLPLLHHAQRRDSPRPPAGENRRPLPKPQPALHRHLLRRRPGHPRHTRRHPHTDTAGIVSGTAARTETDFSENSGSGAS